MSDADLSGKIMAYRNFCGALGLGQSVVSGHGMLMWNSFQSVPVPNPGSSRRCRCYLWPAACGVGDECDGLGIARFHVVHPFAGVPYVFLRQPVVNERGSFDRSGGVQAASRGSGL